MTMNSETANDRCMYINAKYLKYTGVLIKCYGSATFWTCFTIRLHVHKMVNTKNFNYV